MTQTSLNLVIIDIILTIVIAWDLKITCIFVSLQNTAETQELACLAFVHLFGWSHTPGILSSVFPSLCVHFSE